ncbi:unnamed protein product [Nippostrongylus brasiliensis]|uniref:Uncharacterized protein n=1 Tax=Nippostrongylus brasiliensis TaxID=27835 RepID=A0A158R3G5_NIPBR|nr:unnamed protein product [Nippostrongylus brasiliensis]
MEMSSDGRELRQSHSVPTMLDSDDQQHAPVFEENDPQGGNESADHTPRKPPRSPIVVVNQSRKGSFDLLESERRTRKPTVTDIDWYAAFNMKSGFSIAHDQCEALLLSFSQSAHSVSPFE